MKYQTKDELITEYNNIREKIEDNQYSIIEYNDLRKKINILTLYVFILSIVFLAPMILYYIDIIPASVSFYPLVMSGLIGGCMDAIACITASIGNIGIIIMKSILKISNKRLTTKLNKLNDLITTYDLTETIAKIPNESNSKTKISEQKPIIKNNQSYSYKYNNNYSNPNFILTNNQQLKNNTSSKRRILKK